MTPSAIEDAAAVVAANAIVAAADEGASNSNGNVTTAGADETTPEVPLTAPSSLSLLASKPRQRSSNLTHEQKRLICLHAKQNPTFTQAQLGQWAKERFELAAPPSQSSISHTLKRKHSLEHMKSEELASKRMRSVKFPELDVALANWFLYCQARQMKLQGDEIKAKALLFFEMMDIHTAALPQFSNGWLHSFQSRHGFTRSPNNTLGGDLPLITTRSELFNAIESMAPWDVYWMDETSLQFTMSPDRDSALEVMGDEDAQQKKMTIALCTNADGSDMLDPFFVCSGPLENTGSSTFGFQYAYNRSAWMSPTVFREWLLALDWKMHEENRHILLLLDSVASHQVKKMVLKNVSVRFVASSSGPSSSHLFAGEVSLFASVEKEIVTAVKRRYRHVFLDHVLDRRDERQADIYDVDPLQAVQWVIRCWREVPKALIAQSFVNIGIAVETGGTEADIAQGEEKLDAQIAALLKRLKLKAPMKLDEFLYPAVEHVGDEEMTDQDFVDSALNAAVGIVVAGSEAEASRRVTRNRSAKKPGADQTTTGSLGVQNGSVVAMERQLQQQEQRHIVTQVQAATTGLDSSLQQQQQREQTGDANPPVSTSAIADEEWQNWASSHRGVKSASEDFQALQRVIRLATEMNCEASTILDLNRMLVEVTHTQALALPEASRDESQQQQPQPTGVCRFTFGTPTKQHVV